MVETRHAWFICDCIPLRFFLGKYFHGNHKIEIHHVLANKRSSSLSLFFYHPPCLPPPCVLQQKRHVKKHLFSDTDTDYATTDVSWLKESSRKPKPKVTTYSRQAPVKPKAVSLHTPCRPLQSHIHAALNLEVITLRLTFNIWRLCICFSLFRMSIFM